MKSILLQILIIFILFSTVYSQISVTPVVKKLIISGDKTKGYFSVHNLGSTKKIINIDPENWLKQYNNTVYSWEKWLFFNQRSLVLEPNEKKDISYKVMLSGDIDREVLAMVYFSSKDGHHGINIKPRFGCSLYVYRKGMEKVDASIKDVSVKSLKQGSYCFNISVTNKGNIHMVPEGYLIISQGNQRIEYLPVSVNTPIYAFQKKDISIPWRKNEINGVFHGKLILCIDSKKKIKEKEFLFQICKKGGVKNL